VPFDENNNFNLTTQKHCAVALNLCFVIREMVLEFGSAISQPQGSKLTIKNENYERRNKNKRTYINRIGIHDR
jgi:hypothetical protein